MSTESYPAQEASEPRLSSTAERAARRMEEYFERVGITERLKVWIVIFGRSHSYRRSMWRPTDEMNKTFVSWLYSGGFSFQKEVVDQLELGNFERMQESFNLGASLKSGDTPFSAWLAEHGELSRYKAREFAVYLLETARRAGCSASPDRLWFLFNAKSLFNDGHVHFSWQGVFEGDATEKRKIVKLIDVVVDAGAELLQASLAGDFLELEERRVLEANVASPFVVGPPARFSQFVTRKGDGALKAEEIGNFAARLPKADLHCHIGTAIGLRTVEALALNTSSYSLISPSEADGVSRKVLEEMCLLVRIANLLLSVDQSDLPVGDRAARAVWRAAHKVCGIVPIPELPASGVYDKVFSLFLHPSRPTKEYEVCSAFVAALAVYRRPNARFSDVWRNMLDVPPRQKRRSYYNQCMEHFIEQYELVRRRWRSDVVPAPQERFRTGDREDGWRRFVGAAARSVDTAGDLINRFLERAASRALREVEPEVEGEVGEPSPSERIRLEDLVELPDLSGGESGSLDRYLWGCDLLGSSHLQYPENLLLTAFDLVEQAAQDRVLYTELRCAPVGYTRAGMSAVQATDLLCAALDLACLARPPSQLVRFSVLIGGKRHKPQELDETVRLLTFFLERTDSGFFDDDASARRGLWYQRVASWWRPCQVVGFDLSGREHLPLGTGGEAGQPDSKTYREKLEPLFKYSAFITVHAGEAKSAESIWEAVYRLGARRIGHGLRLRENMLLLDYCVTEGICLELCPTSNDFTNVFEEVPGRSARNFRTRYPLRRYMSKRLQVCLGTDNRQLHRKKRLSDEFERAAILAGGLSRWDLVLLAKSGIRNAFLPEADVEGMLKKFAADAIETLRSEEGLFGYFGLDETEG